MQWDERALITKLFVFLLRRVRFVTVLGELQRKRLVDLGVRADRVLIVPNSCEDAGAHEEEVERKQAGDAPVRLLHLSSLIDTKGYPEFLEALLLLSHRRGAAIEAVLCGPITGSQFSERFRSASEATTWIEETLAGINRGGRVRVEWVRGARGDAKWALYRQASIFVFPTRYRVEAQPLVLLEAMAHGCAIITSTVGEIGSILSGSEARFLTKTDAETVAEQIEELVADAVARRRLGHAALTRFKSEFSLGRYVERWDGILSNLAAPSYPSEHPNS